MMTVEITAVTLVADELRETEKELVCDPPHVCSARCHLARASHHLPRVPMRSSAAAELDRLLGEMSVTLLTVQVDADMRARLCAQLHEALALMGADVTH